MRFDDLENGDLIEIEGVVGKVISKDKNGFSFVSKDRHGIIQVFYRWKDLDMEETEED